VYRRTATTACWSECGLMRETAHVITCGGFSDLASRDKSPRIAISQNLTEQPDNFTLRSMLRKFITAWLVLAVLVLGHRMQASAMNAVMTMKPSCCSDCDQPELPDENCRMMVGCLTAPSFVVLGTELLPVRFPAEAKLSLRNFFGLTSFDTAPPFRPPRI